MHHISSLWVVYNLAIIPSTNSMKKYNLLASWFRKSALLLNIFQLLYLTLHISSELAPLQIIYL